MEGGSLNLTCQAVSGVRQHRQLNLAQFNSLTSKLVLKAAILLGGGGPQWRAGFCLALCEVPLLAARLRGSPSWPWEEDTTAMGGTQTHRTPSFFLGGHNDDTRK